MNQLGSLQSYFVDHEWAFYVFVITNILLGTASMFISYQITKLMNSKIFLVLTPIFGLLRTIFLVIGTNRIIAGLSSMMFANTYLVQVFSSLISSIVALVVCGCLYVSVPILTKSIKPERL